MKNIILILAITLLCGTAFAQTNMIAYQYWFDTASTNRVTVAITPNQELTVSNVPLNASALLPGQHRLYLRMKDNSNGGSSIVYRVFNVPEAPAPFLITSLRYWTDVSGSYPSDMQTVTFSNPQQQTDAYVILDFCHNTVGQKIIYFQMQDNRGNWSSVEKRTSNVLTVGAPQPFSISRVADTLFAPSYLGLRWHYSNGTPVPGSFSAPLYPLTSDSIYYAVITNECDSTLSTDSITYPHISTGITEDIADQSTLLYPNPTKGNLTLHVGDLSQNYTLTVLNVLGEVVQNDEVTSNEYSFALNQSAGIYIVKVRSNKGNVSYKVLKE